MIIIASCLWMSYVFSTALLPLTKSFHIISLSVTRRARAYCSFLIMKRNGPNSKAAQRRAKATLSPHYEVVQDAKFAHNGGVARFVRPYVQEFETFAKGRWLGRQLLEVMGREFGSHPPAYWQHAIAAGHIRINNQPVSPSYVIRDRDKLLHRTHRHEPPIFGQLSLLAETETLLVVNKPPSWPMHACGGYRFNSLEHILRLEPLTASQPPLFLLHRLDRVTSGLVLLAKSKPVAAAISREIREKNTVKVYLARVRGRFPGALGHLRRREGVDLSLFASDEGDEPPPSSSVSAPPSSTGKRAREGGEEGEEAAEPPSLPLGHHRPIPSREEVGAAEGVGYFVGPPDDPMLPLSLPSVPLQSPAEEVYYLQCPLSVVSHRDGVHACDPLGKPSLSLFRSLGYHAPSDSSLVLCRAYTGRTHQLRLHLQLLLSPIANDPCYGGRLFYGEEERRERAIEALVQMRRQGITPLSNAHYVIGEEELQERLAREREREEEEGKGGEEGGEELKGEGGGEEMLKPRENESDEEFLLRTCKFCNAKAAALSATTEHLLHCDGIWLHAWQYSGQSWSFSTPLPPWALPFFHPPSEPIATTT